MSRSKDLKINRHFLFEKAAYYYETYASTKDLIAYGRYCELRDIMIELNISKEYVNYRFGKGGSNGENEKRTN